jgi:hypothetical protein
MGQIKTAKFIGGFGNQKANLHVKTEMKNVTVLNDIGFTF